MTLIDFNKKELHDIYSSLSYTRLEIGFANEQEEELYNRLTKLMEKVSQTRSMCTCNENVSEWTLLLHSDWPTTPMKLLSGMIVTPNPQRVKQICDNSTSCTFWIDYAQKSIIMSTYTTKHMKQFIIEEKFIGYANIYINAETKDEAIALYNSGHYKDSQYFKDDFFYNYEFDSISEMEDFSNEQKLLHSTNQRFE